MQEIAKSLLFSKNLKLFELQNLTGSVSVLGFNRSSDVEHLLQGNSHLLRRLRSHGVEFGIYCLFYCKSQHIMSEEIPVKHFAMKWKRFLKCEDGPTAVEYAVMLSLIIVVCLTAVTSIGKNAKSTFTTVSTQIGTSS